MTLDDTCHSQTSLTAVTGRIVPRALGAVNIPDHLTIIDGVFGLTELIQPSSVKARRSTKDNVDPLGYIYPGVLRQLYNIPSSFPSNPKSSLCVAEFLDSASFNKDDVTAFNYWLAENVHVDTIVGGYNGANPFLESSLDVQVSHKHPLLQMRLFSHVHSVRQCHGLEHDILVLDSQGLVV